MSRLTSSFACQLISIIITTLIIHHSFTLSLQAQNLPFQSILPTLDFFYLPDYLHDNGTYPPTGSTTYEWEMSTPPTLLLKHGPPLSLPLPVTFGTARRGLGGAPARPGTRPRCTKCNCPPINHQCINQSSYCCIMVLCCSAA